MIRADIINTIGRVYLEENIENGEFSYQKALSSVGKNYKDYILNDTLRNHKNLDLRFVKDKLSILVETKQRLEKRNKKNDMLQLQQYAEYERELTGNSLICILASTVTDEIIVFEDGIIDDAHILKNERKIRSLEEYQNEFLGVSNNKLKVIQNTYDLNELLHSYGINEKIRSQFVGTCLLALKNNLIYKGLTTKQIRSGVQEKIESLLDKDLNKVTKLAVLKNKVIDHQNIKDLKSEDFMSVLDNIKNNILPFINDESMLGQDLLNLFFTTFNKYVGRADKNQAFTPDHIVHFMCKVVGVNRNSFVLDPCCGSGAFLVRAMTEALNDCDTKKEKEKVKKEQIYGIEYEETAFGLSTTNMLIHGDGNSNIINGSCFKEDIDPRINIVLMNPPYNGSKNQCEPEYVKSWSVKTKEDPSKGFHYVYYIASQIRSGKLAVLLPLQCAIGAKTSPDVILYKKKMLEEHTLDAVFSLPIDMFYPGANAIACCMVFDIGIRHEKSGRPTFFGYFRDDGFVKRKKIGRVEKKENIWNEIEQHWLDLYFNRKEETNYSILKSVNYEDEWLAEAYMETDYSKLNTNDFQKVLNEHLGYLISIGEINDEG